MSPAPKRPPLASPDMTSPNNNGGKANPLNQSPACFGIKRRYLFFVAVIISLCFYFAVHIGISLADLDAVHEREHDKPHEHPFRQQHDGKQQIDKDLPSTVQNGKNRAETDSLSTIAENHQEILPPPSPKDEWVKEAAEVRNEMLDCWHAYKKYAWGHDQLKPISKGYNDWSGNGHALSVVDALGTLWLMGAEDEFKEGMQKVTQEVKWDGDVTTSVFESTIRIVGGLVSAYELSGEQFPQLLRTAREVADMLLYAYNTSAGLPHQTLNFASKDHWNAGWSGGASILADMGSSTIEFRTLSYHTKDPIYDIKATHVNSVLSQKSKDNGYMAGVWWDPDSAEVSNHLQTLGAYGDSYFEYMMKQYLLTGKSDETQKNVALTMLDTVLDRFVRKSTPSQFVYLTDSHGSNIVEHLLCFTGGMYGLASWAVPDHKRASEYLTLGAGLTDMCYQMYKKNVHGIAPDAIVMDMHGEGDFHTHEGKYILRPETVESLFYMWRVTKDKKYRKMAYEIFSAIRKICKAKETGGYTGIYNVDQSPPIMDDDQQTFFLAETLKYLYLIFADESKLPLTQWVFNTEGHPVRIRKRNPLDVWRSWEESHNGEPAFLPPTVNGVIPVETERMRKKRGGKPVVAEHDPHSFRQR